MTTSPKGSTRLAFPADVPVGPSALEAASPDSGCRLTRRRFDQDQYDTSPYVIAETIGNTIEPPARDFRKDAGMATTATAGDQGSPATTDDVRRILGELDSAKLLDIMVLRPTVVDVEQASLVIDYISNPPNSKVRIGCSRIFEVIAPGGKRFWTAPGHDDPVWRQEAVRHRV